ncbi:MAG: hypothetical protein WC897_02365 [Candidatus Gracilibacteria bacterium]
MLNKINKLMLTFVAIFLLFLITIASLAWLKIHWNDTPPNGTEVEVSLPVILWDTYLELSKKPK